MSVYDRTGMWGYLLGGWKDFSLEDGCGFNKLLAQFRATPKRHAIRSSKQSMAVVTEKGKKIPGGIQEKMRAWAG